MSPSAPLLLSQSPRPLERLELQRRHLERTAAKLLLARPNRSARAAPPDLIDTSAGGFELALQRPLLGPLAAKPGERSDRLDAFRRLALAEYARVQAGLVRSKIPGLGVELEAWCVTLKGARFREPDAPLGAAGVRFLALGTNLLRLQLLIEEREAWIAAHSEARHFFLTRFLRRLRAALRGRRRRQKPQSLPIGLERALEETVQRVNVDLGELLTARADTGDGLSGLFSLLALRFVLVGEDVSWQRFLEDRAAPEVRQVALELAGAFPLIAGVDAWLAEHAIAPKSQAQVRILDAIQAQLQSLSRFSSKLVREGGVPDAKRPRPKKAFVIGRTGRAAASCFALLGSPALRETSAGSLVALLASELESYERKLFAATVAPRPRFSNEFLSFAERRFALFPGDFFPLSALCLSAMILCHNLLLAERAARRCARAQRDEDQERAQREAALVAAAEEALRDDRARLAGARASAGDMLAIHLTLEGLRRLLAKAKRDEALASGPPPWPELLDSLELDATRDDLLRLATFSPLAQIHEPALERRLAEIHDERGADDIRPWQRLEELLDSASAGALRQDVASVLLQRALSDAPDDRATFVRVLRRCLEERTPGGPVLVGEVLMGLFRRVFADPWLDAPRAQVGTDPSQGEVPLEDIAPFWNWFCELGPPGRRELVPLLVELLVQKSRVEREAPRDDRRRTLLRSAWHEITELGTRALRERGSSRRARRRLQVFWLEVCAQALARGSAVSGGLDVGAPEWDELGVLGSALWIELQRGLGAYDRSRRRSERLEARFGGSQQFARSDAEQREVQDYDVVRAALTEAAAPGTRRDALRPFQVELRVRGILIPGGERNERVVLDAGHEIEVIS